MFCRKQLLTVTEIQSLCMHTEILQNKDRGLKFSMIVCKKNLYNSCLLFSINLFFKIRLQKQLCRFKQLLNTLEEYHRNIFYSLS